MLFSRFWIAVFFSVFAIQFLFGVGAVIDDPVIAILSQPILPHLSSFGDKYVAASYVKWVESAGARAVFLHWDQPWDAIKVILDQVNGVLFPGGAVVLGSPSDPTPYQQVMTRIVHYAVTLGQQGHPLPVYGTCLGFEGIGVAFDASLDDVVDKNNATVMLRGPYYSQSRFFGTNAPSYVHDLIGPKQQTVFMNHGHGFLANNFVATPAFKSLAMVGITPGTNGQYVAMFEHRSLPIYGSQFHPEKAVFEWCCNIPHGDDIHLLSGYLARRFIDDARSNPNSLTDTRLLAYHFSPVYSAPYLNNAFQQAYCFGQPADKHVLAMNEDHIF